MAQEFVKPTIININGVAASLADCILSGEPDLIPAAAEYGRAVLAKETITEQHRRGMCLALSQPSTCEDYVQMVLLCANDYTTRMDIVRQTAVFVYAVRANDGR